MDRNFWSNDFQKPKWNICEQQFHTLYAKGGRKTIADSWHIAIEITSSCKWKCANCSRAVRHVDQPFNASLEFVEQALDSLKGWNRGVTIMGGEPQEHPQFAEICKIMKRYNYPYAIFTSQPCTPRIRQTFDRCYFTNHKNINLHHPLLIAPDEVIEDPNLRQEVIDKCWYNKGCADALITPWGAFWCEIGGVVAKIIGDKGYPVEPGWWKRESHADQDYLCQKCGLCIPVNVTTDKDPTELVTPKMYEYLKAQNSPNLNRLEMYTEKLTREEINRRNINKNQANLSLRTDREKNNQPDRSKFF
jgi:hypothetical protein